MDDFDRLTIQSAVRATVGDIDVIDFCGRGNNPMTVFIELGERRLGRPVTLIWVDSGLPGHFTLEGRSDLPVVFHGRQVELSAWFRTLYARAQYSEVRREIAHSFTLRLVSEVLLVNGFIDQALQCLAKSKQ